MTQEPENKDYYLQKYKDEINRRRMSALADLLYHSEDGFIIFMKERIDCEMQRRRLNP